MPFLNARLTNLDAASDAVARATIEAEERVTGLGVERLSAAVLVAEFLRVVLEETEPEEILADALGSLRKRRAERPAAPATVH